MDNNNSYLRPVTYDDVSHEYSKWKFYKEFTKISGSVYLRNELVDDPALVTQALLKRCPEGVLRGYAALKQRGYKLLDDPWMPIISISDEHRSKKSTSRGKFIRRVPPKDLRHSGEIKLVSDSQALLDVFNLHELHNFERQVALIDHLIRQRPDLKQEIHNVPELAKHAQVANEFAESPPESWLRVRWHQAGYRNFIPQIRVDLEGQYFYLDLADPVLFVALEYNGGWHYTAEQRGKDSFRKNALKNAGWDVFEVTSKTLHSKSEWDFFFQQVTAVIHRKYEQRRRRLPMQTVS
ncbi:hypothetical protein N24_0545 [Corynebacterium suranareeae]|uniref:DUF559 domain-containing protein n=1 Tax=Corynebacterium suranareeae TaxID=2506452 RepID=A0A160PM01_9CORY|nr:hypothetical protein [Corynebacterium suranareeae]BAU94807.1 hypothetical protein N24_0545 [Corynebacterium suranareeae]